MIRTILIDDEVHCLKTLEYEIKNHCPDITILASCPSSQQGLEAIRDLKPDLVFLDIEMPRMNAFELLEKLDSIGFDIIFTTAYDQYAVDAFKVNAIDYLLKPIKKEELILAIEKFQHKRKVTDEQIDLIMAHIKKHVDRDVKKIPIPSAEGLDFVDIMDIIYCKAESNYTFIYFSDNKKKIIAKTLKSFQEILPKSSFFRPHQSYLVNLHHVKTYVRADGGYLIMSNKDRVAISRNKKDSFLNQF